LNIKVEAPSMITEVHTKAAVLTITAAAMHFKGVTETKAAALSITAAAMHFKADWFSS
jgi:hypothetical protein